MTGWNTRAVVPFVRSFTTLCCLSFQCFGQFCRSNGHVSTPHHIVKSSRTDHFWRIKQIMQFRVLTTGIQWPFVFLDLSAYTVGKVTAPSCFAGPMTVCSICFINRFSLSGWIAWSPPSCALSGGRTSPQFVRHGFRFASYRSCNCTCSLPLLFQLFDGSARFHPQVLSLLAFRHFCAILMPPHR